MTIKKYKILKSGPYKGRIQALRSFYNVKKGDIGGFVKTEYNLSHEGDCWVFDNAYVCNSARVCDSAQIRDYALVCGKAKVYGIATVCGSAQVGGNAKVYGPVLLRHSICDFDVQTHIKRLIYCSLNILPDPKGNYILYKKVHKISEGTYVSNYDRAFIYKLGKIAKVTDIDKSCDISCGKGLHVSTADVVFPADTLIQVQVNIKDIITCLEGKVRCKRLKVLQEINL